MKPNIVDIISKYVELKKLGTGYTGKCPFCGAKGISDFTVLTENQKYVCTKCGSNGGIFQFLISLKKISIQDALNNVKNTFKIQFDADYLDKGWNVYLAGTDYNKVLLEKAKKDETFLETVESNPIRHPISYTELATFIRCPLEYKLRYRDKSLAYVPTGTRVNVGRFLHSLATQFLKLPPNQRNSGFIETKFSEEIANKHNSEYHNELTRNKDTTILLLLQYFTDKTISNQSPHFTTLFGMFPITGTADCLINIGDGIQIIEFKEHDYREFQYNNNVLTYLQLLFYYFGLKRQNTVIQSGAYCFFNNGAVDEIVFSANIINKGRSFIQTKLEEMLDRKEFRPKLNSLCVSCGFKSDCKLYMDSKDRRHNNENT